MVLWSFVLGVAVGVSFLGLGLGFLFLFGSITNPGSQEIIPLFRSRHEVSRTQTKMVPHLYATVGEKWPGMGQREKERLLELMGYTKEELVRLVGEQYQSLGYEVSYTLEPDLDLLVKKEERVLAICCRPCHETVRSGWLRHLSKEEARIRHQYEATQFVYITTSWFSPRAAKTSRLKLLDGLDLLGLLGLVSA